VCLLIENFVRFLDNEPAKGSPLINAHSSPNLKDRFLKPQSGSNLPELHSASEAEGKKSGRKSKGLKSRILDQIIHPLRSIPSQPEKNEPEPSEKRPAVGSSSTSLHNEQILSGTKTYAQTQLLKRCLLLHLF
jgi:hypothetical protein